MVANENRKFTGVFSVSPKSIDMNLSKVFRHHVVAVHMLLNAGSREMLQLRLWYAGVLDFLDLDRLPARQATAVLELLALHIEDDLADADARDAHLGRDRAGGVERVREQLRAEVRALGDRRQVRVGAAS
jgi:hypothetical protein